MATTRKTKSNEVAGTPTPGADTAEAAVTAPKPKAQAVKAKNSAPRAANKPDRAAIQLRAWEIWKAEGHPTGREKEHWLRAEKELSEGR